MLNFFNSKVSVFLRKPDVANVPGILFKKWDRYFAISIIVFVPCFIESIQPAAARDLFKLNNGAEMFLECRLENISGIGRVRRVAQDGEFIMKCFAQSLTSSEELLFFSLINRYEISSCNSNNAADKSTNKGSSGFVHNFKLLLYAVTAGLVVTAIGNFLIWLRRRWTHNIEYTA